MFSRPVSTRTTSRCSEDRGEALQGAQVRRQRLARPGVPDLHRDLAAVPPDRPVHLTDARRGGRVEGGEARTPVAPQLGREHAVHLARGIAGPEACSFAGAARHGPAISAGIIGSYTLRAMARPPNASGSGSEAIAAVRASPLRGMAACSAVRAGTGIAVSVVMGRAWRLPGPRVVGVTTEILVWPAPLRRRSPRVLM
jgi:hypothetical protein